MKLIRLKLNDKFRSLQEGFEINFHDNKLNNELNSFHPFCLAGLNGFGKSNVLEALASIFYHLECCVNNYPKYAFEPIKSSPDNYVLEYYISENPSSANIEDLVNVVITKSINKTPTMSINNGESFQLTQKKGKNYLPDLIVAYSSGENEILSLPFLKMKLYQYDEYIKDFLEGFDYEKPKSSLLYIDYDMSQALLITLFLFFDKTVLQPIIDELGIQKIQQFSINLHNHWQRLIKRNDDFIDIETIYKESEYDFEDKNYFGRSLDHLSNQIEKLENCATSSYQTSNYMSFDFFIEESTISAIRDNFDHDPYKFFSLFQMLQSLNERVEDLDEKKEIYNSKGFYTDYKKTEHPWFFYFTNYFVEKKVTKEGNSKLLLLKNLSDGEQQFLHTLGICLMLQNKRVLLLLDEPETHFNPDWRSKFITILRTALNAGGDNFLLKDILLTSHSPFIISDCMPDKVIQFVKDGETVKAINATTLGFNTFGASVEHILLKFFGVKNLVSNYSLNELKTVIEDGTDDDLRQAIDKFGESSAKQFLFSELYKRSKKDNI
jgi:restriction system-associated AAA family ATPase